MTATIPTSIGVTATELGLESRRERDRRIKQFVRSFHVAARHQEAKGKVTNEQVDVFQKALNSDRKVKNGRTYAEQLYFELYQIAGDFFDDVRAWLAAAIDWLIENWETVLKVALTLLMLLI